MLPLDLKYEKGGYTLVELIITIVIIGIIAGVGAYVMTGMIQSQVYLPSKLNIDMIAADIMKVIIDGDTVEPGLRFSREVTRARRNQIRFINSNGFQIRYRYQNNRNRVQRRIINGPNQVGWRTIPYYATGVTISRVGNRFFTYYDEDEDTTNNDNNVRRVEMTLIAEDGGGNFDALEGQTQLTSSVKVNRYVN